MSFVDRALRMYQGRYAKALAGDASPRQAIGTKCLECCAWDRIEAAECRIEACPLWAYNPWRLRAKASNDGSSQNPGPVNDDLQTSPTEQGMPPESEAAP